MERAISHADACMVAYTLMARQSVWLKMRYEWIVGIY